jgi:hypothetical protein
MRVNVRIAQAFEQFQHGLGLGAAGLALEFALVGLAGIQQEQRVTGGRGVEHDEAVVPWPTSRAKARNTAISSVQGERRSSSNNSRPASSIRHLAVA